MKTRIFSVLLFALVLTVPFVGHGYVTTDQSALRISDSMALFGIEYMFGHEKYDFYMPVRAERNQPFGTKNNHIGFEVRKNGEVLESEGKAFGVVIANMPFTTDEYYKISAGSARKMTLYVVLEADKDEETANYQIAVTDLPFYRGVNRDYMHLNEVELRNYTSPSKSLNTQNQTDED
jgi:hypothetical protein